ncbi:MAG: HAMP domain-containing histidine kinase [Planctomycetales bacterium]
MRIRAAPTYNNGALAGVDSFDATVEGIDARMTVCSFPFASRPVIATREHVRKRDEPNTCQDFPMRLPIQQQLLLPFLLLVIAAIVSSSVYTAYSNADWARRLQEEDFQRLAETLARPGFPLTEGVLRQMKGLSGAEFVLLNRNGRVETTTYPTQPARLRDLVAAMADDSPQELQANHAAVLADKTYLCGRIPVQRGASRSSEAAALLVLYPEDRWRNARWKAIVPPLQVGAIATLAAILVSVLLARRFVRPIKRLREHASQIAEGAFGEADVGRRDDEFRDLAVSLNQMAGQLARQEERIRGNERLRTLGQLGGGIAHQLRNSVTGAMLALELHQRECATAGCESLQVVDTQLVLMRTYLQRFLTLGRAEPTPSQAVELAELVEEVLPLIRPLSQHNQVALDFHDPGSPLQVRGDPDSLRQLIVNLIMNAVEAASQPGKTGAFVRVELETDDDEQRTTLRVIDSGPGPADAVRDRLFEPFATEKPDGAGLGLSVCKEIAARHEGTIRWERREESTCFEVEFPLL